MIRGMLLGGMIGGKLQQQRRQRHRYRHSVIWLPAELRISRSIKHAADGLKRLRERHQVGFLRDGLAHNDTLVRFFDIRTT